MAKFCTQMRTVHVQNVYWFLYLKMSLLPKNDIFQQKYLNVGQQFAALTGQSAGWLAAAKAGRDQGLCY